MQGDYYIDSPNLLGKYGGFAVVDVNARYALTEAISLDLQVRNLADRDYAYVWYDSFFWGGDDQPMFSAAPGRSFYLSLNFKL
jgi:iron complex outermembrane receptor protein